jgi:glycerol dehydrogenase-like iron-containing ADH family enzyme
MKHVSTGLHSEQSYYDPEWKPPRLIYGSNLIRQATETDEKYAIVTMEVPFNLMRDKLRKKPDTVVFVPDTHKHTIDKIEKSIPDDIEMVIGLGGGSSHDGAKYVALKKNARLIQFPTLFGGDASVTTAIGIRGEGRVRYIGQGKQMPFTSTTNY